MRDWEQQQRVKEATDIVALIERYVKLRRSGRARIGVCPFCNQEKAFTVYPAGAKAGWHCYACKKGGDVFNFLMEKEGKTFVEALKQLGAEANIRLGDQPEEKWKPLP